MMKEVIAKIYCTSDLQPNQVVQTFEILNKYYPGAKLNKFIDNNNNEVSLNNAMVVATQAISSKRIPMIYNDQNNLLLILSGYFMGSAFYANTPLWYILIQFSQKLSHQKYFDVLFEIAENLKAYWGTVSPKDLEGLTQKLFQSGNEDPNLFLPKLMQPNTYDYPEIPAQLGWINYWSSLSMKKIDPDQTIDFALLNFWKLRRLTSGATIFQLTPLPLEITSPVDLEILSSWYDMLPIIGNRQAI